MKIFALLVIGALLQEPETKVVLEDFRVSAEVPVIKVGEHKLAVPRFAPSAVSDGTFIYVSGGADASGQLLDTVERFEPLTGQSKIFARLNTPRFWHSSVFVDGKILILGGDRRFDDGERGDDMLQRSVEIIDTSSGKVTFGTPLPEGRGHAGCVLVGREVYLIGGSREISAGRAQTNRVLIYSLDEDRWTEGPPMPTARNTSAVLVNERFVVAAGGFSGKSQLNDVEVLDAATREWRRLNPLRYDVGAHSLVWFGNYLILFGDYVHRDRVLFYNLKTKDSHILSASYRAARHSAAVTLADKIYVIGGKTDSEKAVDYIQVFSAPPKARKR